ncbi:MAG: alpha/beta hydrolase [Ilumatobacteraceae bacterium]
MPLHRQTAELLEMMASFGFPPIEETTPDDARAQRAAMLRPSPEPILEWRDLDASGVRCRFYRPAVVRSPGLLVWLHGGGWVLGDLASHDDPCRALANRGGFCVLSVDYRLAPEHPFPAAVDDALAATSWASVHLADLGCRALAVGGDSAGGNLAAVVANRSPVPLCFQLLVYPAVDRRMGHPSITDNGDGYFLTAAGMRWFYDHYTGGDAGPDDPRLSPLLEDRARLGAAPAAMVITAEFDPLRDEGEAYAAMLGDAGVATSHVRFDGQIHGFFSLFGLVDDARAAQALAAEAVHTAFARAVGA